MHKSYSSDAIYRFLDELCVRDKKDRRQMEAFVEPSLFGFDDEDDEL